MKKPLGRKAYGSIPHLPTSRLGSGDHYISEGQAKIATEKPRKDDLIVVQEKLDGTNVAVAKLKDHRIVPLTRSGYVAETSPYLQHHLFSDWVYANEERFQTLLRPGEWISGEWIAQAHGTLYELVHEPFVVFDFWVDGERLIFREFDQRINIQLIKPHTIHNASTSLSIELAVKIIEGLNVHNAIEPIEGVVWRVERENKVDFLCKYVRHDKIDGKYLNGQEVWNKNLELYLPSKALKRLEDYRKKQ